MTCTSMREPDGREPGLLFAVSDPVDISEGLDLLDVIDALDSDDWPMASFSGVSVPSGGRMWLSVSRVIASGRETSSDACS
jgi:hypothetical protein